MNYFDRHGRLIGTDSLERYVLQENVVQCGSSEFVVCHQPEPDSHTLSVYNSKLTCLRDVYCKNFWNICCNRKFVFGQWSSDDDDDDGDNNEQDKRSSVHRIRVHHLDTLSEAFELRVPRKYKVERILADEHHLLAMCGPEREPESSQWLMIVFDLATCNEIGGGNNSATDSRFSLTESPIHLNIQELWIEEVFLLDGWLVVPSENEILWFDKEGNRSKTSTKLDTSELLTIYSSRSVLLFAFLDNNKLMMKRL